MPWNYASPVVKMSYDQKVRVIATHALGMGIQPRALLGVARVESGTSGVDFNPGFNKEGRPVLLYEPHVFSAQTKGQYDGKVPKSVSDHEWEKGDYTSDPYGQLEAAMALNSDAALKSASYGIFQVMGENYEKAGYDSVDNMILGACYSEGEQIRMMIRFIEAIGAARFLRMANYTAFARFYNGPDYLKNNYANKLTQEVQRGVLPPLKYDQSATVIKLGSSGPDVKDLQERINALLPATYHTAVDSDLGPGTYAALERVLDRAVYTIPKIYGDVTADMMTAINGLKPLP